MVGQQLLKVERLLDQKPASAQKRNQLKKLIVVKKVNVRVSSNTDKGRVSKSYIN